MFSFNQFLRLPRRSPKTQPQNYNLLLVLRSITVSKFVLSFQTIRHLSDFTTLINKDSESKVTSRAVMIFQRKLKVNILWEAKVNFFRQNYKCR